MTRPTVLCYHQDLKSIGSRDPLVRFWQENWQTAGWSPRVLGINDARSHPDFQDFAARVSRYPTVNPSGFDLACYMRWLAAASVSQNGEWALFTDYDVMNRRFTDERFKAAVLGCKSFVLLESSRVPCCVAADKEGFEQICDILFQYRVKPSDLHGGRPHVSDMTIIAGSSAGDHKVECYQQEWGGKCYRDDPGDGWKHAPMIHFASDSFRIVGRSGPKHEMIRAAMAALPPVSAYGD